MIRTISPKKKNEKIISITELSTSGATELTVFAKSAMFGKGGFFNKEKCYKTPEHTGGDVLCMFSFGL